MSAHQTPDQQRVSDSKPSGQNLESAAYEISQFDQDLDNTANPSTMNLLDRSLQSNAVNSHKLEEMPASSKPAHNRKSWAGSGTTKKQRPREPLSKSPHDKNDGGRPGLLTAKRANDAVVPVRGFQASKGGSKKDVIAFNQSKVSGSGQIPLRITSAKSNGRTRSRLGMDSAKTRNDTSSAVPAPGKKATLSRAHH